MSNDTGLPDAMQSLVLCVPDDREIMGRRNDLDLYAMPQTTYVNDETNRIKCLHIGHRNNLPTKTVLLLGETGAGKTTLINSIYNHFYGVKFEDNYRMTLLEDAQDCVSTKKTYESQTEGITGYLFYTQPSMPYVHYNLMIIDTPGFNDTRGTQRHKEIMKQMKVFLEEEQFGIFDLHCIALVVKANLNRDFEYFQKFIEQCLSLFGKNTRHITNVLKTHAIDRNSNVKQIFENSWGLHVEHEFNFDNGGLYSANKVGIRDSSGHISDEDEITMTRCRWNIQKKESDEFFQVLFRLPSVSLRLTRDMLKEKAYLEQTQENLTEKLDSIMKYITANRENRKMLVDYEDSIQKNRKWCGKETVLTKKWVSLETEVRWYQFDAHVHNCQKCQKTCSAICHIWIPCPNHETTCITCNCPQSVHGKSYEKIEETLDIRNVNGESMKTKFEKTENMREEVQKRISNLKIEESSLKSTFATVIKHIILHIDRLNQITGLPTKESPKLMTENFIKNTIQNHSNFGLHLDEDCNNFLKSIFDMVENIQVDKNTWVKGLEDMMKNGDSAWDKAVTILQKATVAGTKMLVKRLASGE